MKFAFKKIGSFFFLQSNAAKSFQSCLTLCDPIDGSPPGSPVPGILQARTLEWGAIAFSRLHRKGPIDLKKYKPDQETSRK